MIYTAGHGELGYLKMKSNKHIPTNYSFCTKGLSRLFHTVSFLKAWGCEWGN